LTAGTFQHEVDHLDGVLFVDRSDSVSSWDEVDFEERARAIVERYGS
jgi:peptide deformylase